ncbi:MAG: DUF1573 domain-containing protein, partial [Acidobacteria bacterium]|nr:DUF1573 domain-containing protein [Acidobacteriota bacterium]
SKWAKVFGAPVGLFGGGAYLVLAILGSRPLLPGQRAARTLAAALVLLIPGAALWFVALQIFVLKAFCPWCCTTHAIATMGAVMMAFAWRRDAARAAGSASRRGTRAAAAAAGSVWGAAGAFAGAALAGLLVLQALSPEPPKPRMKTASMSAPSVAPASGGPGNPSSVVATSQVAVTHGDSMATNGRGSGVVSGLAAGVATNAVRRLSLHEGRFVIDPHVYPCNGSPDAERLMVMISDYTCPHCRTAYKILKEVREVFDHSRLGITMLPSHHGGDSQELQTMMTLIQRLGPGRLEASIEANRAWVQATIDLSKEVYAANRAKVGSGSIPQFIMGEKIMAGAPTDAAELYQLLEENLHLVRDQFPELAVAESYDLGRVFAGTGPALSVPYTNTGKAMLHVSRATVPQGGRVIRGLQVPVEPGRTGVVEIAVGVPREAGPFEQTVTMFSNSRKTEKPVRVKGVAWKPVRITPSVLDLGHVDPDSGTVAQGVMRIELDEDARLQSVQSQNPGFAATLREVTPGRVYEVVVQAGKSLPQGAQQTTLRVTLQKPAPPDWPEQLALAARAVVERAVSFVPQRLLVPEGVLTTERHSQVLVRCNDGTPGFAVTSAVLDGGPAFLLPEILPG